MCSSMNCCSRFCRSLTFGDGSKSIRTSGFLQDGDLAGVIEIVLDYAVQQKVNRIGLAGTALVQALGIERGYGAAQFLVRTFQVAERDFPASLAGRGNSRPVLVGRGFELLAFQAPARDVDPCGDMQHEFPNRMNIGPGPNRGLLKGYALK